MNEFLPLIKDFGFPAVVALWLLWRLDSKLIPAVETMAETSRQNAEHLKALTVQITDATKAAGADHADLSGLIDEATRAAHQAATHARKAEEAAEKAAASADKLYGLVHGSLTAELIIPATPRPAPESAA